VYRTNEHGWRLPGFNATHNFLIHGAALPGTLRRRRASAINDDPVTIKSNRGLRSFQSGMTFPSDHPWWQNGMPQSMRARPDPRAPLPDTARTLRVPSREGARHRTHRMLRAHDLEKPVTLPIGGDPGRLDALQRSPRGGVSLSSSARL